MNSAITRNSTIPHCSGRKWKRYCLGIGYRENGWRITEGLSSEGCRIPKFSFYGVEPPNSHIQNGMPSLNGWHSCMSNYGFVSNGDPDISGIMLGVPEMKSPYRMHISVKCQHPFALICRGHCMKVWVSVWDTYSRLTFSIHVIQFYQQAYVVYFR